MTINPLNHVDATIERTAAPTAAPLPVPTLIDAQHITVIRQGRTVLDDVSLDVQADTTVTLIGPNGAGKSTLVKVILGLIQPDSGHIQRQPGMRIGYVPQQLMIEPTLPLTVHRFVALGQPTDKKQMLQVMAETDTEKLLNRPVQRISGGEFQRVMLARALLRNPHLLILDEPAQAVDVTGQADLYGLIHQVRKRRGCGVLMVSHDLHLVMATTDWVICLNRHICCAGYPENIRDHEAYQALFGTLKTDHLALYQHRHHSKHVAHSITDSVNHRG